MCLSVCLSVSVCVEFPRRLVHLLRNTAYLCIVAENVFNTYVIIGIFANVVRYLEIAFYQKASVASVISGVTSTSQCQHTRTLLESFQRKTSLYNLKSTVFLINRRSGMPHLECVSLPTDVITASSVASFKQRLKTLLFTHSFDV